jgi:hypothetical protein
MLLAKRLGHEDDHSSAEVENDRNYMPSWFAEGQAYFYCILIILSSPPPPPFSSLPLDI